jgi:hypothetical protein
VRLAFKCGQCLFNLASEMPACSVYFLALKAPATIARPHRCLRQRVPTLAMRNAKESALGGGVPHVVESGAKKQMGRVHARRVVALVADEYFSAGNGAVMQNPRHSSRTNSAGGFSPKGAAKEYDPVSVLPSVATPKPARIGFFDLGPESPDQILDERELCADEIAVDLVYEFPPFLC